jgi:hypothetical protein
MSEFTKVNCEIPNGVVLRLFEEVEGPFGLKSHIPTESMTLNGGENDVDSEFFDKWLKVNSDNHFVKEKFIERID